MYIGFVPAQELLKIHEVDVCDPTRGRPDGYQRPREDNRCRQIADYLTHDGALLPNSVLANLRPDGASHRFEPSDNGQTGVLHIEASGASCVWIVDGQHRLGAFEKVADPQLLRIPLPVVFLEGLDRVKEANLFFVVNSKQRNVSPSLKYYDLMRFGDQQLRRWLEGPDEDWKVRAGSLIRHLNDSADSPWHQKVNMTGAKGVRRPTNLVSFVTAMRPVVEDRWFATLDETRQLELLKTYWSAVQQVWPEAWEPSRSRHHLLLKSLGVYAMSAVGVDVLHYCRRLRSFSESTMAKMIDPLDELVDGWSSQSSISRYGGMKGYKTLAVELRARVREVLLDTLESTDVELEE